MKLRYAIIVLVLLLLVAVRVVIGVPQTPDLVLTFTGQVDIAMGPDGKLLVLIDEGTAAQPNEGLVDQAFRLQEAPSLAYSGQATVTYVRGRLTVQIAPDSGWIFNIPGRALPPPDLALTAYDVQGIVRLWGDSIHKSPATLFSTLSSGTCSKTTLQTGGVVTLAESGPACRDCQVGGPGVSGCTIDCGGGSSCEADCDGTSYACCSCPRACGCCSNSEITGSAHH